MTERFNNWTDVANMKHHIELIEARCDFMREKLEAIAEAEKQEQGEPVALKKGECWPEEVMRQWDYWRKEIANGHKGSAPRDWFEGLSELKLIDTTPQQRKPLTDEQIEKIYRAVDGNEFPIDFCREIEAAHGIKGEA